MRRLTYFVFTVLILLSSVNLQAKENVIQIVSPQDYSLHRETTANIVVKVTPNKVDELKIITSIEEKNVKIGKTATMNCKNILLRLGENRVTVRAYKDGKMVGEQIARMYVASDIFYQFRYPPIQYKQTFFHTDKNEALCKKCHDMTSNEIKNVAFIDVTESNCYACHSHITKDKFGHAPAVNWLCGACHDGKAGVENMQNKGRSKYLAAQPVDKECFKCHKSNYKRWSGYRYRHEPLDSGNCNKCHNPHSSPYSKFVRKPVDEICLGCHKDKHIKARELHNSACAGGVEKDKNCVDCHNPHASNRPFFLRDKDDQRDKKEKR